MAEDPSDLVLERYVLGELDAATKQGIAARENEPAIAARLAAIRASNAEILRRHAPDRMATLIMRRAERAREQRSERRARMFMIPAGIVTVASMALVVMVTSSGTERTKGLAPHLVAWRKTAGEPEQLASGAQVRRGDVLQLGYVSMGARHGVIVSLDGRGQATLHFPAEDGLSTRLQTDPGTVLLEDAYELDDAPAFERFFFVTSDGPLEPAAVVEAVHRLSQQRDAGRSGAPVLPGKTRVSSLLVEKP